MFFFYKIVFYVLSKCGVQPYVFESTALIRCVLEYMLDVENAFV